MPKWKFEFGHNKNLAELR